MELRSQFNYDTMAVSNENGLECKDKSLAQQHQKEESDINTIVKRFGLTGQLPENVRIPQYGDFTGVTDYQSALHAVKAAEESFMELPANIRTRFNNNPQEFLEFCADGSNKDEAIKLGLIKSEAKPDVAQAAPATGEVKPA